jgi:hypothetical protein
MTTLYIRTLDLKEAMSDAEVLEQWRFALEEVSPALERVAGVRSVKHYLGAGALRTDLMTLIEMEDGGVYDSILADANVRKLLGRLQAGWDMRTTTHSFRREVTAEMIKALLTERQGH